MKESQHLRKNLHAEQYLFGQLVLQPVLGPIGAMIDQGEAGLVFCAQAPILAIFL
jgi:hypothetical protein